jgi:hypothetical protein
MLEQVASAAVQVLVPHMNRLLPLVLLVLSCGACKKSSETKSVPASSPIQERGIQQTHSTEPKIPACTLITTDEVGAIQGATITDAKNSAGVSGGMLMSQCYYSSKEPNMSVSLAVIEHNPQDASAPDARSYWAESFRRSTGDESDEEKPGERKEKRGGVEREEKEKRVPPKRLDGIGEEAYWSGNRFGGALYVLAKDAIVRISVGGPDNEQIKIDKSKALALKALERLP